MIDFKTQLKLLQDGDPEMETLCIEECKQSIAGRNLRRTITEMMELKLPEKDVIEIWHCHRPVEGLTFFNEPKLDYVESDSILSNENIRQYQKFLKMFGCLIVTGRASSGVWDKLMGLLDEPYDVGEVPHNFAGIYNLLIHRKITIDALEEYLNENYAKLTKAKCLDLESSINDDFDFIGDDSYTKEDRNAILSIIDRAKMKTKLVKGL